MSMLGDGTPVASRSSTPRIEDHDPTSNALAADPKFKRYTQQVDKSLATFESINEWADFISFLAKLLKTFQSFMQFKEIPRKLTVSKRLAQCLNPALPSGVHQKALDVYSHILSVLGSDGLARDLQIWSSGLFPFFQYASTSVKPALLNIYDTHYLPLQARLRPVMKAFILALLPGLEEETSEFYEKVLSLLDRLSGTVSPAFFLQNLWLVLLTTPSARPAALNYLLRRLPKMKHDDDITPIVGNDLGLMVRAFAASLEDENLLVRRGIMDLLVQSLCLDSLALARCQSEDRLLLMRATVSVVLRRDLSLNRRLYSWLLGPSEISQAQVSYFREHGLTLLQETLTNEMSPVSSTERGSRPYKIFISLLDKSEIGIPLTDRLCLDALAGLKQSIESEDGGDTEVLLTANTLYEAMEPSVVWAKVFHAVADELRTEAAEFKAVDMLLFILLTFHVRDEEIAQVHLPVFFTAILELLNVFIAQDCLSTRPAAVLMALKLATCLLNEMPRSSLIVWMPSTGADVERIQVGALGRACSLYAYDHETVVASDRSPSSPLVSVFEDLLLIATACSRVLRSSASPTVRQCCDGALAILSQLVDSLESERLQLNWQPLHWFREMLESLSEHGSFNLIDRMVSLVVSLAASGVQPPLSLNSRPVVKVVIAELLRYLEPQFSPYHARACQLLWAVDSVTTQRHVEAVICQGLSQGSTEQRSASLESLGVLWRLTDDVQMPGFRLRTPMLLVLNCLKSEDPHFRRIGETWMRCSLKSYTRVLDPILLELTTAINTGSPIILTYNGKDIHCYQYERPVDQARLHYILESLLSLVRFGGQGFNKSVTSTVLAHFHDRTPFVTSSGHGLQQKEHSYMDLLIEVMLRCLQTEPTASVPASMDMVNVKIQSTAIDVLQLLISRGEVDRDSLGTVQSVLVAKLYSCVHSRRLDLQNKLLHVLHSVILARGLSAEAPQRATKNPDLKAPGTDDLEERYRQDGKKIQHKPEPLLVQTLIDGITRPANRPVLQHWVDFILMTVPQFLESLYHLVVPLCDSICGQLRTALAEIYQITVADIKGKGNLLSAATDAEFVILLNALERLVLISLSRIPEARTSEDDLSEKPPDSGGLFGYVFGTDTGSTALDEHLSTRSPGYHCLHEASRVLFGIWTMAAWQREEASNALPDSLTIVYSRMRLRSRRVFERLFRAQSIEVLESIIEFWHKDPELPIGRQATNSCTFDIVDSLTPSAQILVNMICESAFARTPPQSDRAKKTANLYLSDAILFGFLEEYYCRLEGPIALQVWSRSMSLAKEITTNMHSYRLQVFPVLKCITSLAEKVAQTTALEDKRMRRELQDVYIKLVDSCVLIAGRSFEQGNWMRRSQRDIQSVENISRAPSDLAVNEKPETPTTMESIHSLPGTDLVSQIEQYLAKRVLPNLRRFLADADKVAGVCSNVSYYLTTPALKAKGGSLDVPNITLVLLSEMTKIPSASKAWRVSVGEVFNDTRLFNNRPDAGWKWNPLIRSLMDFDKDRFADVISKVGLAPSTTLFTSREVELQIRCMTIRKLSYVLFTGDKDQFLTQLPAVQEKVVDILRSSNIPAAVQAEVYFCMRVVLCRFSSHNISTFWPIILAELVRLFEYVISSPPGDGSEELILVLAACKFLDLLLVLQLEEFQIHQWMFVTDTVDAIYKPDDWRPASIMDLLADTIGNMPPIKTSAVNGTEPTVDVAINGGNDEVVKHHQTSFRKPLLVDVSRITSIRDLAPFFSHVSISFYESVYAGGTIDWDTVERGLMAEMFEGR